MTTIYHNPRCSKSRETLKLLQDNSVDPTIVEYLKDTPTHDEMKKILSQLGFSADQLMRKKEVVYKELGLKDVSDENALIEAMLAHPKLIERPIVVHNGKAKIGRPPESVLELF